MEEKDILFIYVCVSSYGVLGKKILIMQKP